MTADEIITILGLKPLPDEGGMYKESTAADEKITSGMLPGRYKEAHPFYSNIYYLLTDKADSFSALHKLKSDETWHFYSGDPLELLLLYPDGRSETIVMGSDLPAGHRPQVRIPRNIWQGARLIKGGAYALTGMSVAPGYIASDFTLGDRTRLISLYPDRIPEIMGLTRNTKRSNN